MTQAEKLTILKQNLQMITGANDEFLNRLLEQSSAAIKTEGIRLEENNIECDMAVIDYAAYLFRKRASQDTAMPRFLRYNLNNLLFKQKGGKL